MASLAAKTPKPGLAQLEEAGGPALSPSRGTGAPGRSPGPRAPPVTQASWKRRGRARRIPRHTTRGSPSDRCPSVTTHGHLWWLYLLPALRPPPAVRLSAAPAGIPGYRLLKPGRPSSLA